MRLYFLRHGPAASRLAWTAPDAERPLTDDGVALTRAVARKLRGLGLGVTSVLTSPYARAHETAVIAAEELGLDGEPVLEERLEPGFGVSDLREILAGRGGDERLMLVGHEPDFSVTISATIGGGRVRMKKSGLARVDIDDIEGPEGRLAWLAPPKLLAP